MNILSIQSWVTYGHVGNAAALFPLQRLGAEVWAVNTVQFSNHPGHGSFTGEVFTGSMVASLVEGMARLGVLAQVDAVLSGYLGDQATLQAVLDAVQQVRALRPDALYCCDPVMGDRGIGLYVQPGIPAMLRDQAVAQADILTPNQFELEQLGPEPRDRLHTLAGLVDAATRLRQLMRPGGACCVLVTSVDVAETPPEAIDLLLACNRGTLLLRTPRLAVGVNGAGDLIAALFLFHLRQGGDPVQALELAASSVWGILRETGLAGAPELRLVQAQGELVSPSQRFRAELV
ncbi:pyridoxal kinase PdxY [Lichenicola sp.]|uniref:pyridoxal kinase PdxY n=1 Tax=Lichenicola sp. TaxID=2804529 RepID=UPI003B00ECC0